MPYHTIPSRSISPQFQSVFSHFSSIPSSHSLSFQFHSIPFPIPLPLVSIPFHCAFYSIPTAYRTRDRILPTRDNNCFFPDMPYKRKPPRNKNCSKERP